MISEGGGVGWLSVLNHQWLEAKGQLRDNTASQ
jgi:hypothetical protein